jgi:hypothetical protein
MRTIEAGKAFLAMALALGTAGTALLHAQPPLAQVSSMRAWIGREAAIEAQLKSAHVTRMEDIGTGVTRPRRMFLDPSDPVASATWKLLPPGRPHGHWESYKSEIAAYELDKLLGMHMVPPAVEREVDGDTGAAIMWIDGAKSVKQAGGRVPNGEVWGRAIRRMQLFDNLVGNPDRNAGNILLGAPGELILIDHSRAFVIDQKLPFAFERVDQTLWERVSTLTKSDLASHLGPWIGGEAVDAILQRRTRLAKEVDKLVEKKGKAVVIIL